MRVFTGLPSLPVPELHNGAPVHALLRGSPGGPTHGSALGAAERVRRHASCANQWAHAWQVDARQWKSVEKINISYFKQWRRSKVLKRSGLLNRMIIGKFCDQLTYLLCFETSLEICFYFEGFTSVRTCKKIELILVIIRCFLFCHVPQFYEWICPIRSHC